MHESPIWWFARVTEIAAPGVGTISAFSSHTRELEEGAKCTSYWEPGGFYHYGTNRVVGATEDYTVMQGTSMACPNATGAIALLLQNKPDLTAAQLRTLFSTTARVDDAVSVATSTAQTASTDTDGDGGAPNGDWGEGKLDVGMSIAGLPTCANACLYDSDCGGGTCTVSTSLSECSSCPVTCTANVCGGCATLTETPGDACGGVCGAIACDGGDATICNDPGVNACTGCAVLGANPGDSCGTCGTVACDGSEATMCNDPGGNACGGCGTLPAGREPGVSCGTCGTYECSGNDDTACNDPVNACGGCATLTNLGDACGANSCGSYVCDATDNDNTICSDPNPTECLCGANKATCTDAGDCCSNNCRAGKCKGN